MPIGQVELKIILGAGRASSDSSTKTNKKTFFRSASQLWLVYREITFFSRWPMSVKISRSLCLLFLSSKIAG